MVWEIETRVNGQVVTFLVRPLQLPVAYMKANPEIKICQFYYLKTQNARRQLCSRRHFANPASLLGFQTAVTSWGAWHPVVQKVGADNSSVGITTRPTCYSDHMSPEETGQL